MKIKPASGCNSCHGSGEVYDWVDYGSTKVMLPLYCECVQNQIPEYYDGYDPIELDYSDDYELTDILFDAKEN